MNTVQYIMRKDNLLSVSKAGYDFGLQVEDMYRLHTEPEVCNILVL